MSDTSGTTQPVPPLPDWVIYLLGDTTALQMIFWIVAIFILLAVIIKIWPALRNGVNIIDAVAGLPAYIKSSTTTMEKLRHQVENDHDTNLREELTEALELSKNSDEKLDKVLAWQSEHMKDYLRAITRIENLETTRITIQTTGVSLPADSPEASEE
jgi:hypothetical protein